MIARCKNRLAHAHVKSFEMWRPLPTMHAYFQTEAWKSYLIVAIQGLHIELVTSYNYYA